MTIQLENLSKVKLIVSSLVTWLRLIPITKQEDTGIRPLLVPTDTNVK